jgi:HEAT repeat protein
MVYKLMGSKVAFYAERLKSLKEWDSFLLKESGLPGPRGNLELAQAFADIAEESLIKRFISIKPAEAPENSAKVFLTVCGVVGLGTLVNNGKLDYLKQLREFASDQRWRIREAVAIALQRIGDADTVFLLQEMIEWSKGSPFEKRASIAALCEPRLLTSNEVSSSVLSILDDITSSIVNAKDNKNEAFEVLKKGLAYCWSVAVAACPGKGKILFEKWVGSKDKNVMWIMKENLKKNRLLKMDKEWVLNQVAKLKLRL